MQAARAFGMNVWRVCVYECNIASVSIPEVCIVCIGWVSLPYVFSCDRHVRLCV